LSHSLPADIGAITGRDFFTTEVWAWRGLVTYYTLFVLDLASRRLQIDSVKRIRRRQRLGGLLNYSHRAA
jgi:hypothetical protein